MSERTVVPPIIGSYRYFRLNYKKPGGSVSLSEIALPTRRIGIRCHRPHAVFIDSDQLSLSFANCSPSYRCNKTSASSWTEDEVPRNDENRRFPSHSSRDSSRGPRPSCCADLSVGPSARGDRFAAEFSVDARRRIQRQQQSPRRLQPSTGRLLMRDFAVNSSPLSSRF